MIIAKNVLSGEKFQPNTKEMDVVTQCIISEDCCHSCPYYRMAACDEFYWKHGNPENYIFIEE